MARQPRAISRIGYYHVVSRGNNHREIFEKEVDFQVYCHLLEKYCSRSYMDLYHYCLMGNHVHLVLRADIQERLSRFMHDMQRSFFLYKQKQDKLSGHLWESRFHSSPIEDESYLLECGRYIERNPVRAGLVEDPGEHPWSSYRFYAYGEQDSLVAPSPLYEGFGKSQGERQQLYQSYVKTPRPYENQKLVPGRLEVKRRQWVAN